MVVPQGENLEELVEVEASNAFALHSFIVGLEVIEVVESHFAFLEGFP